MGGRVEPTPRKIEADGAGDEFAKDPLPLDRELTTEDVAVRPGRGVGDGADQGTRSARRALNRTAISSLLAPGSYSSRSAS